MIVATRIVEELVRYRFWVLMVGLVVLLVLALVSPTKETPEEEP